MEGAPEPRAKSRGSWRHWAFAILGVILIVFIILNAQEVEIDFIVATATAPLVFALAIAGLLGFGVGWLAPRLRRRGSED